MVRSLRVLLPAVLVAGLLLSPGAARAAGTYTIGFDDFTGAVLDHYMSNADPLKRVDFSRWSPRAQASPDAVSDPNNAVFKLNPAPRLQGRRIFHADDGSADLGIDLGHEGVIARFPFQHQTVSLLAGHTGTASGEVTLRAYDASETLITSDTVTVNGGVGGGFAYQKLSVFAPAANITWIEVEETGGQASGWEMDDFTFDVPDTLPLPDFGLTWPGRSLGSVSMARNDTRDVDLGVTRVNGSNGPISFSAANLPAGVTASFLTNPVTGSDAQTDLVMRLHAASNAPATPVGAPPGVVVRATPDATAGTVQRQVTVSVNVVGEFDLRARGLDITQGVQAGGPGDGLPQVPVGPRAYDYAGVDLVGYGYKPTIVRLYADAHDGVGGGTAELFGFRDGKPLPDSPLKPDSGGALTDLGPSETVTYNERLSATQPFNFTIPPSWLSGKITLRGHVFQPPTFTQTGPKECAGCGDNNTVELRNIGFTQEAVIPVDPIRIVYSDRTKPGAPFVVPTGDWASNFQVANQLMPLDLLPHYWRGDIDVTTHKVFKGFKGWVTRSFLADDGIARNDKSSEVNDKIGDFADDYADLNFPVGMLDTFNLYNGTTDDLGQTKDAPIYDNRPELVVNPGRPYTSVAHEIGHALDRKHASGGCGGAANGEKADPWPDAYGYIHSVGMNLNVINSKTLGPGGKIIDNSTTYTPIGGSPSPTGADCVVKQTPPDCGAPTPSEPYDYMSYCANDSNAWISAAGWNAIIRRYNLGPATGKLPQTRTIVPRRATSAKAKRPGLRIEGWLSSSGGYIENVEHGRFASVQGDAVSPLTLTATNAAGRTVASVKAKVSTTHTDGKNGPQPVVTYEATLPTPSAAGVRLVQAGKVLAGRNRSPHAPTARFTSPKKNSTVGRRATVLVRWKAADKDHDPLDVALDYSGNGGGSWHEIYAGPDTRSGVKLPARYFSHARRARVRLRVTDGFNVTTVRSPVFRALGAKPIARITVPVRTLLKPQDAVTLFSGVALDDTDRMLTGKRLRWLEGSRLLGTGANIGAVGLAAGRQRVTLVATDSSGRTGRASVIVNLRAVQPSVRKLTAPKRISRRARSVTLRLSTSVESTVRIGKQRFRAWSTARGLKVKVKPGRSKLRLKVRIASGRYSATRTVTITRR